MLAFDNTCVFCFILLNVYIVYSYWISLLAILLVYSALRPIIKTSRSRLDIGRKGVFITGCDTGFGHHLAKRLDDKGYTVYAGVLSEQSPGAKALQARQSDRLHVIKLDVTKDDDVEQALTFVRSTGPGLWAIVNNAGIDFPADVELATVDQYKRCAEVNLYGMIRVIKAFLPMIRKSKGRIVNMSSVKGRYSWPGDSVYIVTKHGIETMSDSLRLEMKKFGVKVAVIEPGQYDGATSISSPEQLKRLRKEIDYMWEKASEEVRQTYGRSYFDAIYQGMERETSGGRQMSADPVMNAIEDSLINVTPQARYLVGGSFSLVDKLGILAKVYNFLPEFISDRIVEKMTGCASFTR
ncbi:D-beta-hydroxybutyrate dehydrogenase, mitochondrial-like [Mizuhopecten yessoensis]|uniref:D-beta-hydroxybutyrate dehydrogenase, mitochondrial-like n=1 Tax=Mizuhopecten yessoensis TaxID=6573 RepID=UPI000B45E97A|nr:D-beta-hydroxybutyrate dehydrogenase, mitochondrial-like [Mizuhopecten yessoensis]